jgi:hypothetical protein
VASFVDSSARLLVLRFPLSLLCSVQKPLDLIFFCRRWLGSWVIHLN